MKSKCPYSCGERMLSGLEQGCHWGSFCNVLSCGRTTSRNRTWIQNHGFASKRSQLALKPVETGRIESDRVGSNRIESDGADGLAAAEVSVRERDGWKFGLARRGVPPGRYGSGQQWRGSAGRLALPAKPPSHGFPPGLTCLVSISKSLATFRQRWCPAICQLLHRRPGVFQCQATI